MGRLTIGAAFVIIKPLQASFNQMQALLTNKVMWGVVLTFLIGGLGAITGLVSDQAAVWVTLIISALTGIGHAAQVVKGTS